MLPRIAVVEDEEALSVLLRYNLEAEGYEVDCVARGDEADLRLREQVPDLVLLDWMLPGLSGIELCRRIRARQGSLPTGQRPFDVVVANLIASLLVRLAGDLRTEVAPGGTLLASGIFVDREAEVREAFEAADMRVAGRLAEGDWVALEAAPVE